MGLLGRKTENRLINRETVFKFGSMCLVTGALCAAGGALAADPVKNQVILDFATTDKTGWVLAHRSVFESLIG